jgi:hypothetical protein
MSQFNTDPFIFAVRPEVSKGERLSLASSLKITANIGGYFQALLPQTARQITTL